MLGTEPRVTRPLSQEERKRALGALEAAKKLQAEVLAKRDGVPFDDSTEIIRQMREESDRLHAEY